MRPEVEKAIAEFLKQYPSSERDSGSVTSWLLSDNTTLADPLKTDFLYELASRIGHWRRSPITSKPLVSLISKLAKTHAAKSVIDPMCGTGALLDTISWGINAKSTVGVEKDPELASIARRLLRDNAEIIEGDLFCVAPDRLNKYDLIVADAPLPMRPKSGPKPGTAQIERGDNLSLVLWCAEHMSPKGLALVTVPSTFFWQGDRRFEGHLNDHRLAISAAFYLPSGTHTHTHRDSYLLALSLDKQRPMFVGQLQHDEILLEELINNYRRHQDGSRLELGKLINIEHFSCYKSNELWQRVCKIAEDQGCNPVSGQNLFLEYELIREGKQRIDHTTASCYLSVEAPIKAAKRLSDFTSHLSLGRKPNFLHLLVNTDLASSQYLVSWINSSDIGKTTMRSLTRGFRDKLSGKELIRGQFYIENLNAQKKKITFLDDVQRLRGKLSEYESTLLNDTSSKPVIPVLKSIGAPVDNVQSINGMPYPLAAILHRYDAQRTTPQNQKDTLINFFEATAIFLSTIHLSAFMNNHHLWEQHGQKFKDSLSESPISLQKSTFGTWNMINDFFSGIIRKRRSDLDLLKKAYCTESIEALGNLDIYEILKKVAILRNKFKGHTGPISDDLARQIVVELETHLHSLNAELRLLWNNYELIQPLSGKRTDGTFHVTVNLCMGPNSDPFKQEEYKMRSFLDTESLYLFNTTEQTSLPLKQLLWIGQISEKSRTTCYFYSRREKIGDEYLSYSMEQYDEVRTHDRFNASDVFNQLELLD
jgi:hypothetical protein